MPMPSESAKKRTMIDQSTVPSSMTFSPSSPRADAPDPSPRRSPRTPWSPRLPAARECVRDCSDGGDEFLVVARGLDQDSIADRLNRPRQCLRETTPFGPPVSFSVGIAELEAGGRPEAAVEAADQAMYRAKSAGRADRSPRLPLRAVTRRPR
ncbi:MAG TPA: diguanylate cyclase [Thermoanaerobaculia bacterium]|nr:diguanylate cyclase [Thermoanaerobaculia bacterium]